MAEQLRAVIRPTDVSIATHFSRRHWPALLIRDLRVLRGPYRGPLPFATARRSQRHSLADGYPVT